MRPASSRNICSNDKHRHGKGGYTIGKVWHNHDGPDASAARFPVGTVACKVLFTQATTDQVPYLANPIEWKAFAEIPGDKNHTRKVQTLRLLQMDVMVRDSRAERINGTGWVFGTFCYNGTLGNPDRWYNLVPSGSPVGGRPINAALRAHLHLLTPEEMRTALARVNMSQKEAADRLGIAEATLSRWLTETQIQSRAMDNLLRVFFAFPQVRTALNGQAQDPQLGAADISGQRTTARR